jgi:hypothetical protein
LGKPTVSRGVTVDNINISGSELALFTALLSTVAGVVSVLFRMLMAEKSSNFASMLVIKNEQILEERRQADLRYSDMKNDRDLFKDMFDKQQSTIVASITVITEGVAFVRKTLEQSDLPERRREPRR